MAETKFTPGPWDYIPSTEHHGPYVTGPFGGDVCDCYAMSNPSAFSVRNGGDSKPIHFQPDHADANAQLIAQSPALYDELRKCADMLSAIAGDIEDGHSFADLRGKYVTALIERRDDARAVLALAHGPS